LECVCKVLFGSHVALEEGKGCNSHNLHIYKHTGPALERRLIEEAQERVCLAWAVELAGEPGCRGSCRPPGSGLKWEME